MVQGMANTIISLDLSHRPQCVGQSKDATAGVGYKYRLFWAMRSLVQFPYMSQQARLNIKRQRPEKGLSFFGGSSFGRASDSCLQPSQRGSPGDAGHFSRAFPPRFRFNWGIKNRIVSTIRSVKTKTHENRTHVLRRSLRELLLEIYIYRTSPGGTGLGRSGCGLVGVYHQLLDLVIDRVGIRHDGEARDGESWKRRSGYERPCTSRSLASTHTPPNLLPQRARTERLMSRILEFAPGRSWAA